MKIHLGRRLCNAAAAFTPGEANYRLAIGEFDGFTVAYREGTADEKVIAHSFQNDIFLDRLPQYRPGPSDVVIDVGAHIGTFSLLAASKCPGGVVHAVEASQETFDYLRINAALNPRLPIRAHRLALTDRDGEVVLHHDRGNWGHSIMKELSAKGETVPALSLATFFARNAIERAAFVKFNCEGAEFPILMQAPDETLARIEKMLVLYHLDLAQGYSLEKLLDRLAAAGFGTKILERKKKRGWVFAAR